MRERRPSNRRRLRNGWLGPARTDDLGVNSTALLPTELLAKIGGASRYRPDRDDLARIICTLVLAPYWCPASVSIRPLPLFGRMLVGNRRIELRVA